VALLPILKGSVSITTSAVNIDSTGYYYHHIAIYITSTIQSGDSYTLTYYKYNPVAGAWVFNDEDIIDFTSTANNAGTGGVKKCWEINASPGDGLRVTLIKNTGNNGTADYEIIRSA
jgi:hypothetical protein